MTESATAQLRCTTNTAKDAQNTRGGSRKLGLGGPAVSVFRLTSKSSRGVEWEGYPPPEPTRGFGERHKLPSGVRGRAPAEIEFCKM